MACVWIMEFEFYDFVLCHIAMDRNVRQQKKSLPVWADAWWIRKYGFDKMKMIIGSSQLQWMRVDYRSHSWSVSKWATDRAKSLCDWYWCNYRRHSIFDSRSKRFAISWDIAIVSTKSPSCVIGYETCMTSQVWRWRCERTTNTNIQMHLLIAIFSNTDDIDSTFVLRGKTCIISKHHLE